MSNLLSDIQFLSGDIGLSRSTGFMAKAILFMTSWHTGEASVNHAFAFVDLKTIIEATTKIKVTKSKQYDKNAYSKVEVYRLPLDDQDRRKFRLGLFGKVNGAYGWLKLPLFALDAVLTKVSSFFGRKNPIFFFTKYFGIFNIPVCSQLVVYALHKFTSYELRDSTGHKVEWRVVSPDFLEDLLLLHHNGAHLIYSKDSKEKTQA